MKKREGKKIRVLIADDSSVGRRLLASILSDDPSIEVVAMASDGKEAFEMTIKHKPDVVSMDINMPVMDGIEATKRIMSFNPVPVIIVSSIYRDADVMTAIKELEAGAVMVLPKPHGPGHETFEPSANKYLNAVKLMAEVKVVRRNNGYNHNPSHVKTAITQDVCRFCTDAKVVAIGSSAGGPEALKLFLSELSPSFPLPILLVQHIDSSFTHGFTAWLNSFSSLKAVISEEGEEPYKGNIYMPPPDRHMIIKNGRISIITESEISTLHKPSVDVLFYSVAKYYKEQSIGIILSGMGKDGADGLNKMKNAGAFTFIQDSTSALIYGMPGEAEKLGAACAILSPVDIAKKLNLIYTK